MDWEVYFVVGLLLLAMISFVREKISTDLTSIIVFAILLLVSSVFADAKLPSPNDLLKVFATPAPITIAAMFILSAALEKCGAIELLADFLSRFTKFGFLVVMFFMIVSVGTISAFINNTPVVVIFVPVVLSLARQLGVPASKMLIPLSYASIFGGVCTLVGTSTNILGSSILESQGYDPISMFELGRVGLPLMVLGTLYLIFICPRLLPDRVTLTSLLSEEERKEFMTTAIVSRGSPAVGKSAKNAGLLGHGIRLLEIVRNDLPLTGNVKDIELAEGDRLILACRPQGFAHARSVDGVKLGVEEELGVETIAAHEGMIVEGVVGPLSSLIGKTTRQANFRMHYRMVVMAIHRKGENIKQDLDKVKLRFGDTLLMMGSKESRENLRRSNDLLLLDRPETPSKSMRRKVPIVLGTLFGVVICVSIGFLPMLVAAILGCAILFVTKCITPEEGYAAVDWSILILIFGMIGLGMSMQASGTSTIIANSLSNFASSSLFPPEWKPYILLAGVYIVTSLLTEVLSNNATIVLMAPIALGLGSVLGVDPRAFVVATCIASSASFSTPIGYQTNTYVYGVGNYRFTDFLKSGLPMNIMYCICSVIMIPFFWEM